MCVCVCVWGGGGGGGGGGQTANRTENKAWEQGYMDITCEETRHSD